MPGFSSLTKLTEASLSQSGSRAAHYALMRQKSQQIRKRLHSRLRLSVYCVTNKRQAASVGIIDEGVAFGLALEGISAADVARQK
jgi:hypothetical protein